MELRQSGSCTTQNPNHVRLGAQAGDGAFDGGGAGRALTDLARELLREPGVLGPRHKLQGLRNTCVGKQVEERRLLELGGEPLAERAVKNRVAGGVSEIGEYDGVFFGKLRGGDGAMPEVEGNSSD